MNSADAITRNGELASGSAHRMDMRATYIYVGSAILAILVAILAVVAFAPEGTRTGAPNEASGSGCEKLTGDAKQRCLAGASGNAASSARDVDASTGSGRNPRGSGIEGVTSGGTTEAPPR